MRRDCEVYVVVWVMKSSGEIKDLVIWSQNIFICYMIAHFQCISCWSGKDVWINWTNFTVTVITNGSVTYWIWQFKCFSCFSSSLLWSLSNVVDYITTLVEASIIFFSVCVCVCVSQWEGESKRESECWSQKLLVHFGPLYLCLSENFTNILIYSIGKDCFSLISTLLPR